MRSAGASFSALALASVTLASCVGSSTGADLTGPDEASEAVQTQASVQRTTTSMSNRDVELDNVDPVRAALVFLQQTDPSLGTLLRPQEGLGIEECALEAVSSVLTVGRLNEVVTEEGMIDVGELTFGERTGLAQEIGPCHQDTDLLHRLVNLQDPPLADCVMDKLIELDRIPDVLVGLLAGTPIASTSPMVGFGVDCRAQELDERFGDPPGGTTGTDLQLMSDAILRKLIPASNRTPFENVCLRRATMASISVEWVLEVRYQPGESPLHPIDYLLKSTDPSVRLGVLNAVTSAAFQCIEPFNLYAEWEGLYETASASQIGCLRDGLSREDLAMLNKNLFEALTDGQSQGESVSDEVSKAFLDCGLELTVR